MSSDEDDASNRYSNGEFAVNIVGKLDSMYTLVEDSYSLLNRIVAAQDLMSHSAKRMADTNEAAELRYAKLEEKLDNCNERAAGKGMIPLMSHFFILGSAVLALMLILTYITNQTIKGTLTSLEVGQHK